MWGTARRQDRSVPWLNPKIGWTTQREGTLPTPSSSCRKVEHPTAWVPLYYRGLREVATSKFPTSPSSFTKCPASSSGSPFSLPDDHWPVLFLRFSDLRLGGFGLAPQLREKPRCWEFNPGGGTGGPSPGLPCVGVMKSWSLGESGWE